MTWAVGDGRSDVALFERVGLGVTFNGSAVLRALATVTAKRNDLRGVPPVPAGW